MPKVKETRNRIIIHVGDLWKKYHKHKNSFIFRIHDVGRKGKSERIAVKYRGRWRTYAWSFSKDQVVKVGRNLLVYDDKAYDIIKKLKSSGDLKAENYTS